MAAYGLIVQHEKLLLCRLSSYLALDAGFWTLPGGGVDFGEDPADAMVREVHEETGLLVKPASLLAIDSFKDENDRRHFHGIRIIYRAEVIGGELRYELEGSTDFCAWWSFEEAKALPLVGLANLGINLAFAQP
ncbi:MAG: NUDIX domain-containing protein [Trueperaceae bacterium]|nr:NUDIX domain-containing protein [Trueperaceae bacterium]